MAFTPDPTLAENARALIDQLSRYARAGPGAAPVPPLAPLPPGAAPAPDVGAPTPTLPTIGGAPVASPGLDSGQAAPTQAGFDIPPVLGIAVGAGLLYYVLKKK